MKKILQSVALLFISFFCYKNEAFSQSQLSLKNFSVFGGDSTASFTDSAVSGVEFASNISLTSGGSVGSQTYLVFKNQVNIDGDVYGNTATIGNSLTINAGSLSIFNRQGANTNILNIGALVQLLSPGDLNLNGNGVIASGVVNGTLTQPAIYNYSGPSPDLGTNNAVPIFPRMPLMPAAATFPAAGIGTITSNQTITPGSHGAMALTASQAILFSGPGTYVFSSITNSTNDTFKFDFQNNLTGSFRIYIQGDANLGSINVSLLNGGSSSRVYTETHGTGNASNNFTAFTMNPINASFSNWEGTVYAPNGAIRVGNTNLGSINNVNGCLWSRKKVYIGINTSLHYFPLSETANPIPNILVRPYYPPPADGKINTIIGSELTSIFEHQGTFTQDSIIYQISGTDIYIEVIALQNQAVATTNFLVANGLTNIINNGPGSLIISGKFPIANLLLLNARADIINYARPLYHPLNNSGVVTSRGDTAMYSNLVRAGYNLTGQGVKVGVISDSYNTIPGNFAAIDVANGDLPGPGNPYNDLTPVQVVGEYPFGQSIDEGRAMLQIVHDVAPKAQLAFRTGFVSAGDFAQGIGELATSGCKVIVDDVTYITEPYFKDGVIARAVDNVVAGGTTYFSAAGNFGKKSYEATFDGTLPPATVRGITSRVHNFGSGNPFQTLTLSPGNYTIVLQWDDNIYSLGGSATGTQTDLDIYLTDNLGATLFGFNRNNIGGDPIEVLPFTVTAPTTASIIIALAAGPPNVNVKFKYIVFRGNPVFTDYAGSSTLVGQANSAGAIAVGAVLYSNTPPYNLPVPTIASFSSVGGDQVDGVARPKPELTAPNGVNTSVNFNSVNIDDDVFPNFFGTSAAAPHAAAAAALLIEGKMKFLGETISPAALRTLLQTTALDMGTTGYDPVTGYGFIQPFAAMQTFASPIPELDLLQTPVPLTRPVTTSFIVTVKGKGLNPRTQAYLGGTPLTTVYVNNETVTALIPPFTDNPTVQLFNPSIIPAGAGTGVVDGGLSNSLFFFSTKKHVLVKADDKTKKYGEKLPAFTATITVDGVPLQSSGLTAAALKLDHLAYTTPAATSSNVSNYFIHPVNPLNPANPADALLLTQYEYEFGDGVLSILKLPLKITPRDTTLTYGQKIHGIRFNYVVGPSSNLQNPDSLASSIRLSYSSAIIDSILALVNGSGASSRALVNNDLLNLSIMISSGSGASSRALVNNGSGTTQTTYIVDVDVTSIFNYLANPASSPLVNGSGASSRALVNTGPLINGTASVLVNGSGASSRALVNGDPTLLNSSTTGGTSNTNVAVIVSDRDVPAATNNSIIAKSVNMVTGGINIGSHFIVPAAFISGNYEISYGLGKLTITKALLQVKANTLYTNTGVLPPLSSVITGYQYQDGSISKSGPVYAITPTYTGKAGIYTVRPSALTFKGDSNYLKSYVDGILYVNPYTSTCQRITLSLKCVGKVTNGPSGLQYVAHFIAKNTNSTTVYIPPGADNFITATGKYSGVPPGVFPKGSTNFDVYFDGKKITWTVKSLQCKVKCTESVVATSTTCKCTAGLSNTLGLDEIITAGVLSTKTEIFPNPVTSRLTVKTNSSFMNEKDVTVLDVNGRILLVKAVFKSAQTIDLNVSGLAKGTYFVRIRQEANSKTISFVKL
ncbi:MAG: S8 family serine peptidase [Ginsengibacter sp.]